MNTGSAISAWRRSAIDFRAFGHRYLLATIVGIGFVALALGIPTDLVPNPWFIRMTPPGAGNYFFWIGTSVLAGALLATYVLPRSAGMRNPGGMGIGGGVLGLLAAGCPVCNKLVVMLLGVSGALTYFEPIQPVLGALGMLVAGAALVIRLRGVQAACVVSSGPVAAARQGEDLASLPRERVAR